ncbi:MAG: SMP-30/gluconolactonase/LRE family protein [Candidatus Omnitrophica bacterium]|nr:SMP-30/gluconolactonase/LRE family protein [Candidatus Omnitrophota bacterium]
MFPIPNTFHSGSGYTAIEAGLDGNIYVGTAFYGSSAHLVRFTPKSLKWEDIIDAHKLTREKGIGLDSQSKFHAKILVDKDGVVWAATKQGNENFYERPEFGENSQGYPGGHLFSFDPKTEIVIDHGILRKQEGIMGGAIDRKRKKIYYWSDPKQHLLVYDIQTGTVKDCGTTGGSPRYMAIDNKGRVFGTGRPGIIWMYDPKTDRLYDLTVKLDGPGQYRDPYAMIVSNDGNKIFAVAIEGEYVMEFDLSSISLTDRRPDTDGSITCFNVDKSYPEEAGKPGDQHTAVLGKNGCLYFPNVIYKTPYLMRYDPEKKKVECLGIIRIKGNPELEPLYAQGACVTNDGTIYMMFISAGSGKRMPYSIVRFNKLSARK